MEAFTHVETLSAIPIDDIIVVNNYRDAEPVSPKDPEIIELSKSIAKDGFLQSILVRPSKTKTGKFELIFGHRRIVAGKIAKMVDVPARIKEIADDEILEIQVTENLQRKDVHPMDEAIAFRKLMEQKKITIDEIALRFAKSKEFVTQRLKLNDLIPELQNDFKSKKFSLGHALQFSRISANDQKDARKGHSFGDRGSYGSVSQLANYIDRNIVRNLSKAPFKKDDAILVPAAGSCKVCPKRSGANPSLFGDIAADDRCFDGACFDLKIGTFMVGKIREIIETRPSILIVANDPKHLSQPIKDLAKEMDFKILEDDLDCKTYAGYDMNKKAIGFLIDGYEAGKEKTIYLKGGEKIKSSDAKQLARDGKLSAAGIIEEIKKINDREKRARQLDINKVHSEIEAQAIKMKSRIMLLKPMPVIDRAIMIYILLTEIGYNPDWRNETMGYADDKFNTLSKWTDQQLSELVRKIVFDRMIHNGTDYEVRHKHTAIRMIARYAGIDIKSIEKKQAEVAASRGIRVAKRIADLKGTTKNKPAKAPKKAAKKKGTK